MAEVIIKNLYKTYRSTTRKVQALKNINLHVKDGEFFVILGPSGCGKSTLLNVIAGLETPDSGEIKIGSRTVFYKNPEEPRNTVNVEPGRRNLSMVFQSYALYPHLNVFENIAFPLRIIGKKALKKLIAREENIPEERIHKSEIENYISEKVRQVASLLEIEELLESKPAELSGGQRQRVAIARSLVKKPSVLLMDEPLSNLDARLRLKMREELKNLQRKTGITIVYVTHDQSEASFLASRIAVIKEGSIEQIDTPEKIYSKPATIFVGTFYGSPPAEVLPIETFFEVFEVPQQAREKIPQQARYILIRAENLSDKPEKGTPHGEFEMISFEKVGPALIATVSSSKSPHTSLKAAISQPRKSAESKSASGIRLYLKEATFFDPFEKFLKFVKFSIS